MVAAIEGGVATNLSFFAYRNLGVLTAWERDLRQHPRQMTNSSRWQNWLCDLRIFASILVVIGAGLADGFALAKADLVSPLEMIASERPMTPANVAGHAAQRPCTAEALCSFFMGALEPHPDITRRKSAGLPLDSRFPANPGAGPISPPPKPASPA